MTTHGRQHAHHQSWQDALCSGGPQQEKPSQRGSKVETIQRPGAGRGAAAAATTKPPGGAPGGCPTICAVTGTGWAATTMGCDGGTTVAWTVGSSVAAACISTSW